MSSMPIIKIEMEGIRQQVGSMIADHNNEINEMVQDALKQTLNEEWVRIQIQENVNKCVKSAISNLSDNYVLKSAVECTIAASLTKMMKEKE